MFTIIMVGGVIVTLLTVIPVFLQMRHHPKGLFVCFFAEMWERFSFYGMRGLLIFYLTQHFLFDDNRAADQYGSYATLVYLLPLVGGLVADRWIGTRKAIIFGGLLLVIGHFGMGIEGKPNTQTLTSNGATYEFVRVGEGTAPPLQLKVGDATYTYTNRNDGGLDIVGLPTDAPLPASLPKGTYELGVKSDTPWAEHAFYLSLGFIVMGVGFLKPNISTLVGQLYPDRDPRRDSGFQLYYFGINLGSFWAALLCGYLGQTVGWWAGFGLAGVGMLAGLVWFVLGRGLLQDKGLPPNPEQLKVKVAGLPREGLIYFVGLLGVPLIYLVVQRHAVVGWTLGIGALAILIYVAFNMITKLNRVENYRLGLAMVLSAASVIFFTLFEQAGSSLNLFSERNTDLNILSAPIIIGNFVLASRDQLAAMTLPVGHIWIDSGLKASQTQSFNAGFILIFAPVFAWLFTYLAKRNADPDPVKKFSFGLAAVGLGFLVLVWGAGMADSAFKLPLIFLVLTYLFHTWGELALSPVGLSQQTKLSPPMLVSTMMAIWFLGSAGAHYLAGIIAKQASSETVGGQVLDARASLETSLATFNIIGWWGVGLGAALFVLSFFISKWAHGVNDSVVEGGTSK